MATKPVITKVEEKDYPIADFFEPVTWGWTEEKYIVRCLLKYYSNEFYVQNSEDISDRTL